MPCLVSCWSGSMLMRFLLLGGPLPILWPFRPRGMLVCPLPRSREMVACRSRYLPQRRHIIQLKKEQIFVVLVKRILPMSRPTAVAE